MLSYICLMSKCSTKGKRIVFSLMAFLSSQACHIWESEDAHWYQHQPSKTHNWHRLEQARPWNWAFCSCRTCPIWFPTSFPTCMYVIEVPHGSKQVGSRFPLIRGAGGYQYFLFIFIMFSTNCFTHPFHQLWHSVVGYSEKNPWGFNMRLKLQYIAVLWQPLGDDEVSEVVYHFSPL